MSIYRFEMFNTGINSLINKNHTLVMFTGNTGRPSLLRAGLFSMFQSLVSGKSLDSRDIEPVLEKFRDSLIGKNVASEIATKLCASVETKLIGKVSC